MVAHSSCCTVSTSTARRQRCAVRRRATVVVVRRPTTTVTSSSKKADKPAMRRRIVRRKIKALRRLVPHVDDDGEKDGQLRLDELLLDAAGYIMRLQMQVKVMQAMVNVLNPKDY